MAESGSAGMLAGTLRRAPNRLGRTWVLGVMTLIYSINVADRFVLSTLIEPIKAEFHLSDSGVGFLTGTAFAICYATAGLPLGTLADRAHRRNMIARALVVWSIFTALCGMAQSFWQLLAARIGVGFGEAGATPASHSMLADYFARKERVIAMSVFTLGIAIGSGFGGVAGGMLADAFGWRHCLILFACFSASVIVLLLTVQEPERGASDPRAVPASAHPTLIEALRFVRGQRALLHIFAAGTIADFAGGGLIWWTPAFLGRSHGFSVGQAGMQVGLMSGLGGAAALLATMLIALRLARMDARWQCHFLAGLTALITIPGVCAYTASGTTATLLMLWLFVPFANAHVGPMFALFQNLVPSTMRGVAVAMLLFATNIANLALAPQLIGTASDLLARHIADPDQSLRIALAISGLSGLWAAWHFHAAIRTLPRDLERAERHVIGEEPTGPATSR